MNAVAATGGAGVDMEVINELRRKMDSEVKKLTEMISNLQLTITG